MPDERAGQNSNPGVGSNDDMRGGKGRTDEVGRSGIYPASATDAPADAEVRRPGEFVHHSGATGQDDNAIGQDDNLIGAERMPRKGDDE